MKTRFVICRPASTTRRDKATPPRLTVYGVLWSRTSNLCNGASFYSRHSFCLGRGRGGEKYIGRQVGRQIDPYCCVERQRGAQKRTREAPKNNTRAEKKKVGLTVRTEQVTHLWHPVFSLHRYGLLSVRHNPQPLGLQLRGLDVQDRHGASPWRLGGRSS